MPHLHLPADHSDADLMLAANLAAIVGSDDLYVTWTHGSGPGAVPEIEAVVREPRPSLLAALLGGLVAGAVALWRGLTQAPSAPIVATQPTQAPLGRSPM